MEDSTVSRAPRLLMISGAAGAGKSTLATNITVELGFNKIAGSDTIREVLRTNTTPNSNPALHRSTFSSGITGEAVTDWLDASAAVESGIEAVIARSRREGMDLIIEGAHVIPSNRILIDWRNEGGVALGLTLTIENEEVHRDRIVERESNSHRGSARYLAAFERIREIQSSQITRAKGAGWKIVDTHLHKEIPERVRQWFDEEWYTLR